MPGRIWFDKHIVFSLRRYALFVKISLVSIIFPLLSRNFVVEIYALFLPIFSCPSFDFFLLDVWLQVV